MILCRFCHGRGFEIGDEGQIERCDYCDGVGGKREDGEPDFTLDDLEWSEEYE